MQSFRVYRVLVQRVKVSIVEVDETILRDWQKRSSLAMLDPIHQFQIVKLVTIVKLGSLEIAITNSAIYMMLSVAFICIFLIIPTRKRALVPGRLQSAAEMVYEFVADMIRDTTGEEGMQFFPLVFTLFGFILIANVMGLIPYGFTVTSHIIITAALALLVFITVIVVGFWKNGFRFLKVFVPSGIPMYICRWLARSR